MNTNPAAGDQISKLGAEPILLTRLTRRKASPGLFLFGASGVLMAHRVHGELLEDSGTWMVRQGDTMQLFQKLADKEREEGMKEQQAHRQKAREKLAAFLKETLKEEQLKRLRQLEVQQEGLFALFARPDLGKELKITDEQRQKFMAVVQEIGPKIMKIRKEQESRIEALLSDTQKKQWKEMRGKPLDLGD